MKKKLLVLSSIAVLMFGTPAMAQQSKLTPGVKMLTSAYEKYNAQIFEAEVMHHVVAPYSHNKIDQKVDIIVHAGSDFMSEAEAIGHKINSAIGDYYTLHISPADIESVANLSSIKYVDMVLKFSKKLNSARTLVNADKVYAGTDLSNTYKGGGVVLGILDFAFDMTHPAFYYADGSAIRIKRVWNQSGTGTPQEHLLLVLLMDTN